MKVIVFAHRLEIGGTQVNAIDLAARLRDEHGVDPILFATPGPALELARTRDLRFEAAPDARFHPSMRRIAALRALARREHADLVHAWDWWQCLEAYYGLHLPSGVPMIVSDMMMDLMRILPRSIPSTFGTPEVLDKARQRGYRRAKLLVPPIDTDSNSPGITRTVEFRSRFGLRSDDILIVTVSRLAHHLKGESLSRTISAVGRIGRNLPIRFLVVGDGQARERLEKEADIVNEMLDRKAVSFAGELSDPRSAYDAADIVVGMGGSSLRGAAFGKPVIVVGENGFSRPLEPSTGDAFFYHGMYGRGDGDPENELLSHHLQALAENRRMRESNGAFAQRFVEEKFSLKSVCRLLADYYEDAASDEAGTRNALEMMRTAAIYIRERRFLTPSRSRNVN